jgi:SAM-dependent methyltransferase
MKGDHFSTQAAAYAEFRPNYPEELFEFLAGLVSSHECAWDCATGNGQSALPLAKHFQRVIATDLSAEQISHATPHPKILYRVATAEESGLADDSVDLITVSQALHWFDFERFYREVRRVGRPESLLAVWCYGLNEISPELDRLTARYYGEIVGPFWPPERKWVEEAYRTIPFPFPEIQTPAFEIEKSWDLGELLGYYSSWSATQRYRKAHGSDPLDLVRDSFKEAWGDPASKKQVRWKVTLRVGRVKTSP